MKKIHLLLVDTETDIHGNVLDFGAVLTDLEGNILHECKVLTLGYYTNPVDYPLFHKRGLSGVFNPAKLQARYDNYDLMLENGSRSLASVSAINRWLVRINVAYSPVLTAYNLAFDLDKCENTGIDLGQFKRSFCLMYACQQLYGNKKKYRQFILDNHFFNPPTRYGNMTYQTKAETMARFLLGADYPPEPHTAYEDCVAYELPLMVDVIKKRSVRWCLEDVKAGSWRRYIVRDNFKA